MARHFQTQTVTVETVRPGDMLLRSNGKYRRVLVAEQDSDPRTTRVRYNPTGQDRIAIGTLVTIRHRNPVCACGCQTATQGGLWAPGHDGRVAGLGARAITGDTQALQSLLTIDPDTLPTGGPSRIEHNPDANCDASCQFAHRTLCVCNCGGTGHYMGWVRVGQMLLSQVPDVVTPAMADTLTRWATYTYNEGRNAPVVHTGPVAESDRLYPTANTRVGSDWVPNVGEEPGIDAQIARYEPMYEDEEDLASFLRRVIPVTTDADIEQGDCPAGGQLLDLEGSTLVQCPTCRRHVKTYSTGRLYKHQRPAA